MPNGDALYRAAKEALDPVVASAIAGVVDEVEIASGKKNKKKKEDKDYFRTNDDVNESYSLDGDDDDDDDDDDDPTNRSREHEQDINALDGRAKLVAWMQMEKAKRKRLTRKLLKTKDELAKSEASRMAATRRWLEAASQLESERGSQFTQSVAGDGMGSSSDEEGFFDDEDERRRSRLHAEKCRIEKDRSRTAPRACSKDAIVRRKWRCRVVLHSNAYVAFLEQRRSSTQIEKRVRVARGSEFAE